MSFIRNIWAVGRNYKDHAQEMNAELPQEPLVFLKAGSSASVNSTEIEMPWWTDEVHHEVELALRFSQHMQIIDAAVALDLTERNLQAEAKKKGLPWTMAKSFDGACPVSAFFSMRNMSAIGDFNLKLFVNDELKQDGFVRDMIFPPEVLVKYISERFPICPGDLILTGTPAGVGPIRVGDRVKAVIVDQITHTWKVIKGKAPALPPDPNTI